MSSEQEPRPYQKVKKLLKEIGGTMDWRPGGAGGGGAWKISLRGKTALVPCHDQYVNDLDELYVPKVQQPKT